MSDFTYQEMLPLGPDQTAYRLVTKDHVSTFEAAGQTFLRVAPEALTLLAAASIYWRSANVYEPTSYITVLGDESFNGTHVVVASPDHPDVESNVTLTKDNNYVAAVFLHPGSYTVTATQNGRVLARVPFVVSGRRAVSLNLTTARRPAP